MDQEIDGRLKPKTGRNLFLSLMIVLIAALVIVFQIYTGNNKTFRDGLTKEAGILQESIKKVADSSNAVYNACDLLSARNPMLSGKDREDIINVSERADELFNFLQDLSLQCIRESEGDDARSIKGNQFDIKSIRKLKNKTIPAQVLIGADSSGKAFALNALIRSYEDDLSQIVDFDQDVARRFRSLIDADRIIPVSDQKGITKTSWAEFYFGGKTLGRTIITLMQFQYSVRLTENLLITSLYNRMKSGVKT